jgi:hypothetical protein
VQTTHRSAGRAHDGPQHPWLLAAFLLGSPLLVTEAVLATTRHPSNLLVPLSVWGAVNALLLCPALSGRPRPRWMALVAGVALSSRARWSSWTVTGRHRHAGSAR